MLEKSKHNFALIENFSNFEDFNKRFFYASQLFIRKKLNTKTFSVQIHYRRHFFKDISGSNKFLDKKIVSLNYFSIFGLLFSKIKGIYL